MGSFSLVQWIIFVVLAFVVYSIIKARPRSSDQPQSTSQDTRSMPPYHCMMCGTDGWGVTHTRGSFAIEIILWLCFIVPGLLYTVWRLTTRRKVCAACKSESIVPYASPAAAEHRHRLTSSVVPMAVSTT